MDDGNTKELDYKQLRNRMTCTDNNVQAYKGKADDSLDNTKNNPEIDEQFEKSIQKLIQTETNVAKAEYYELRADIPDNNEQMGYNDYRNSTVKKRKTIMKMIKLILLMAMMLKVIKIRIFLLQKRILIPQPQKRLGMNQVSRIKIKNSSLPVFLQ